VAAILFHNVPLLKAPVLARLGLAQSPVLSYGRWNDREKRGYHRLWPEILVAPRPVGNPRFFVEWNVVNTLMADDCSVVNAETLINDAQRRRMLGNISRTTGHRLQDEDPEHPKPVPLRPGGSARYFVLSEMKRYVERLIERRDEDGVAPTVVARGKKLARAREARRQQGRG
jgi:hypothetical protein